MKSVGILEAKARLSELARAAANGDATVLTDYGKPIAMIAPIERRLRKSAPLTRGNFARPCCPSRTILMWVSSATDLSDREECVEDLAYRHRLVCDPRASVVAKVRASTLATHAP
jgi:antitoxin (DNA-binding transcriptional repressor) of toxin-antitoxin stability system